MKLLLVRFFCIWFGWLIFSTAACADAITEWNAIAERVATARNQQPFVQTRTFALLHLAMFEAVNAVEHRYPSYLPSLPSNANASAETAAIAAAHTVLATLFPESVDELEVDVGTALQAIASSDAKEQGIALGQTIAKAVIASRAHDRYDIAEAYWPHTAAGEYVPTVLPVASRWSKVQPWLIRSGATFRPANPPKLSSRAWADAYNEVKALGAKNSVVRTAQETETALFWSVTGPLSWNPLVRKVADSPGRTLRENARLFALIALTTADAHIAIFDAKYHYHFWRPITAIRNGDHDGNSRTIAARDWLPLLDTPLHPEFPCAHCITASAVAQILATEFQGKTLPELTMTSPTAPGITHRWNNFAEYADEVARARVYAGVHYQFSTVIGGRMGRDMANFAMTKFPLR